MELAKFSCCCSFGTHSLEDYCWRRPSQPVSKRWKTGKLLAKLKCTDTKDGNEPCSAILGRRTEKKLGLLYIGASTIHSSSSFWGTRWLAGSLSLKPPGSHTTRLRAVFGISALFCVRKDHHKKKKCAFLHLHLLFASSLVPPTPWKWCQAAGMRESELPVFEPARRGVEWNWYSATRSSSRLCWWCSYSSAAAFAAPSPRTVSLGTLCMVYSKFLPGITLCLTFPIAVVNYISCRQLQCLHCLCSCCCCSKLRNCFLLSKKEKTTTTREESCGE